MIIGQYEGKVGEKYQIAIPKKFREVLGDKLIVTKGFEGCLIVVSEENWKTLLEDIQGRPFADKVSREKQRFILGNASLVELDAKGRFVLPEYLRKYANITNDIIYAGIERFFEIWSKDKWEEQQKDLAENIAMIAEKFSQQEPETRDKDE